MTIVPVLLTLTIKGQNKDGERGVGMCATDMPDKMRKAEKKKALEAEGQMPKVKGKGAA